MAGFTHVTKPTRIPVPGDKLIEEIFGCVNTDTDDVSVAHMVAPPGWTEPAQRPEFAEITIMIRGQLRVHLGDGSAETDLSAGESLRVEPGVRVCYSNPFDAACEYYAICLPAFTLERAHREG